MIFVPDMLLSWSNKPHVFGSMDEIRVWSDQRWFAFSCIRVHFTDKNSNKNQLNGQLNESNYDSFSLKITIKAILYTYAII